MCVVEFAANEGGAVNGFRGSTDNASVVNVVRHDLGNTDMYAVRPVVVVVVVERVREDGGDA